MHSKRPLDGGVGSNCVADCFSPSFALHCCVGLRRIDPKGPSFLQSSPPGDIALGSRCWLQTAVVPSESFSFSFDALRRLILCQWPSGALSVNRLFFTNINYFVGYIAIVITSLNLASRHAPTDAGKRVFKRTRNSLYCRDWTAIITAVSIENHFFLITAKTLNKKELTDCE